MTLNEDLTKLSLLLANNRIEKHRVELEAKHPKTAVPKLQTKILVGYRVCRVQRYVVSGERTTSCVVCASVAMLRHDKA